MLIYEEAVRVVELHRSKAGGLMHTFDFNPDDPLPWQVRIDIKHCECLTDASEAERGAEIAKAAARLSASHVAYVATMIERGAATLTEAQVLEQAKGKFGSTMLGDLRKVGRFPEPLLVNKRNLWLEDEVMHAIAMFVSDEATKGLKRTRPRNRHEKAG